MDTNLTTNTVRGRVHMSQSITGPLMNWKKSDWKRATTYIKRNDGSTYSPNELKLAFMDELAKGREVIPIGECEGFDYKTGCPGHPIIP